VCRDVGNASLEFPTLVSASVSSPAYDLPSTFGKVFSNTGYGGQVIIRSPYLHTVSGDARVYKIYPLRNLEFAYEEEQSGLRSESESHFLLESRYRGDGQTNARILLSDPKKESIIRTAVVFEFPNGRADMDVIDTTDGAEWRISTETRTACDVSMGSELHVVAAVGVGDTAPVVPIVTVRKDGKPCRLDAVFLKGW
jgi:hypothetical protein